MGSNVANIAVEAKKNTSTAAVAYLVSFPQNIVEDRLDHCILLVVIPFQIRHTHKHQAKISALASRYQVSSRRRLRWPAAHRVPSEVHLGACAG